MRYESFDGVVVRVRQTGDHDVLLSVLTAEQGRITILSKGSKSLKGEQRAISQLFTNANFEVYRKGELYILKGGSPLHTFYGISKELERFALASYLCELVLELTDEGEAAQPMLQLLRNTLYSISEGAYPLSIIKAAFEWRAAILSGYAPSLSACTDCGRGDAQEFYLDVMNGALLCADCLGSRAKTPRKQGAYDEIREAELLLCLPSASLSAVRYVMQAPPSRLFSFKLSDEEELRLFSISAERYLLSHIGHGFDTLDFYHAMQNDDTKGTKP